MTAVATAQTQASQTQASQAQASQQQSSQSERQQFLSFQLPGGAQAMLPTEQLTEILGLSLSQVVPIPDIAPSLLGVCNWRGEVLWLLDVGYLLGMEPLYAHSMRQGKLNVIVIQHQGKTLGLGVEKVDQMVWCDRTQIRPSPTPHVTPNLAKCLEGYWSAPNGEVLLVLDGEAVIDCMD